MGTYSRVAPKRQKMLSPNIADNTEAAFVYNILFPIHVFECRCKQHGNDE